MRKLTVYTTVLVAAAASVTQALAGVPGVPPTQVPEPGLFGLAALGAGAVILAVRLKKHK